jgi:class 3 adenylate cyclase
VPTLVIHRRDDRNYRVGHGRYLAEHIPGARYVELPGEDCLFWVGDVDAILDEIEEFLVGTRRGRNADRELLTVLFTDIVGSTERLAEIGERRWRDLLDRHDEVVRRNVERFGGHLIKSTGDGVLVTFDRPSRAVLGAVAIREELAALGLRIRAGVHVGEVERRGDDVSGMVVHVTARIEASAGADEILLSATVADLIVDSGIEMTDLGERDLRGVPKRMRLWRVDQVR